MTSEDRVEKTIYKCPDCGNTSISWHYGKRKFVCNNCGRLLSNFKPSKE